MGILDILALVIGRVVLVGIAIVVVGHLTGIATVSFDYIEKDEEQDNG